MKTVGWVILVIVIGIIAYLGINWAIRTKKDPEATFIKPRLEMGAMQITNMDKQKTQGTMSVLVDNPTPIGFKADSLAYQFFIAGEKVMESTYAKPIELEANDSSMITLPVTIRNQDMVRTLKSLENKGVDSTDYTMKTQMFTSLPFLKDRPLDFEITKKLPLYRIPEVKLLDADLDKLGLNQTKFTVKMEITNDNVFAYRFRDMYYKMTLNGEEFTEGSVPQVINIPAQGKATVDVPVEIKPGEAIQTGVRLLDKSKENTYTFEFQAKIVDQDNDKTFKDSKIRLQSSGDLRQLLREAKEMAKEEKKK